MDELPAMTEREVAGYLNVAGETACRLAKRRELPSFTVARISRFRKGEIVGWIENQLATTPADTTGYRRR